MDAGRGDGGGAVRRQVAVTMSNMRGRAQVGDQGAGAEVLLIDGETQRPVYEARVEALPDGDGFFLRISRDEDLFAPETTYVRRGQAVTVQMEPATPDVQARAVRVGARVSEQELLQEADLGGAIAAALGDGESTARASVVFLAPPEGDSAAAEARFALYRSALPGTLFALRLGGSKRPPDGTLVEGPARVVDLTGARRAGVPPDPQALGAAAAARPGESRPAPAIATVAASAPDGGGQATITWTVDDPMGRLLGFDVGVDTTRPAKRVGKEARALPVTVSRGLHFACVRPVFDGSDVDVQVRCADFEAAAAPAAPDVQVNVRVMAAGPQRARQPVPVEIEVENIAEVDAPAFEIAVVVSRDGRPEGGLGEVRTVRVDGVKARGKTVRRTDVVPPRDGTLFVVAKADPRRELREANPEDNVGRRPLVAMPSGTNRAPVVSLIGAGQAGGGSIAVGQALPLRARAVDPEDGDLSPRIAWVSSRDGRLGEGPAVMIAKLSPGHHRVRAEVSDRGGPGGMAAVGDGPQIAVAELAIEVVEPAAPPNSAPVVSAGPDVTTTLGAEAVPLASARDADGDRLVVGWTVEGPGERPALEGADTLRPRLRAAAAGVYRLVLTVSDGKTMVRDDAVVTVLPPGANRPPRIGVVTPPPARGRVGSAVAARVEVVDDDRDGLTISYGLARPAGSGALLAGADTLAPSYVPDVPGGYTLEVRADDGRGGVATVSLATQVDPAAGDAGAPDAAAAPAPDAAIAADAPAVPDAASGADAPVVTPERADAPAAPDAAAGLDAGGAACNALAGGTPWIDQIAVPAAPPAAAGGVIPDGTYVLDRFEVYTGPGGASGPTGMRARETAVKRGAAVDFLFEESSGRVDRGVGTMTVAGTTATFTRTCPPSDIQDVFAYSITPTHFVLVKTDATPPFGFFYRRLEGPPVDAGAGAPADAGAAWLGDGPPGVCNRIPNTATPADEIQVAQAPPALQGGTIREGLYFMIRRERYTGPGGASGPNGYRKHAALRVSGSVFEIVEQVPGGPEERANFTFTTSGAALNLTGVCDSTGKIESPNIGFAATATELRLSDQNASPPLVMTFTLASALPPPPDGGPPAPDGPAPPPAWDGGPGLDGAAPPCTPLAHTAPWIDEVQVAAPMPTPAGGAIADGVYHLSSRELFTGAGGPSGPSGRKRRSTVRFTASSFEIVEVVDSSPGEIRASGGLTTSAAMITLNVACDSSGDPKPETHGYTATATEVRIFDMTATPPRIETFRLQGGAADGGAPDLAPPSDAGAAPAPADASPTGDDGGAGADGGAAVACNSHAQLGAFVDEIRIATTPPMFLGGPVQDGTYVLTGWEVYTGAGGSTGATGRRARETLVVQGSSKLDSVFEDPSGSGRESHSFTTSNNMMSLAQTCPRTSQGALLYTATTGELTLYEDSALYRYARQ